MPVAAREQREHRLGLHGHYVLDPSLQDVARQYGLRVSYNGNGNYSLEHENNLFDADKFCPSFIEHNGNNFRLSDLRKFLKFLRQPVYACVQHENNASKKQKLEQRTAVHEFLRFITTGSAQIPPEVDEEGNTTGPSCHAESEAILKNFDLWRGEMELGNEQAVQSAIPRTGFEADKGFEFDVSHLVANPGEPNTEKMDYVAWSLISAVKGESYADGRPDVLYLTADELCVLCKEIILNDEIKALLFNTKYEEERRNVRDEVGVSARTFNAENRFQTLPDFSALNVPSPKTQLEALLMSTSALTPVISSQALRQAWSKFHWTKRDSSPFKQIAGEISILRDELLQEQTRDIEDPHRLEALLQRFSSLISFSRHAAQELDLQKIVKVFDQTGITKISVAETFMQPHHQAALDVLRSGLDQGESPAIKLGRSVKDSLKTIVTEAFDYTTEKNVRLGAITALTVLYLTANQLAMNPAFVKKVNEWRGKPTVSAPAKVEEAYVFGDTGLETAKTSIDYKPEAQPSQQQATNTEDPALCHYHFNGKQMVPHCFFNQKIKDFTRGTMDWMETTSDHTLMNAKIITEPQAPFSEFSQGARGTISPTANLWLYLNILQLIAHVPFFYMMGERGTRFGVHAYRGGSGLFSELADSGYTLLTQRPLAVPAMLSALAYTYNNDFALAGIIVNGVAAGALGNRIWRRSSNLRATLLDHANDIQIPEEFLQTQFQQALSAEQSEGMRIRLAGVKQQFAINAHNIQPVLDSLDNFDAIMSHANGQIGVHEKWYFNHINQKIKDSAAALERFKSDGNQAALEKALRRSLADVIGAQGYHMQRSPVYEAAFNTNPDAEVLNLMARHGETRYGSLKRKDRIGRHFSIATGRDTAPYIDRVKSTVASSTNVVWHGVATGARTLQAGYANIPNKKPVLIATGTAAAGILILDMAGQTHLLGPYLGTTADYAARLMGYAYGVGGTSTAYGTYNIYDDILWNDTFGGLTFLTLGVVLGHYGYRNGVRPALATANEKFKEFRQQDLIPYL